MGDEPANAAAGEGANNPNRVFELVFIVSQIIIGVLYSFTTEYGEGVHPAFTTEGDLDAKDAM
jgi:hypothetical protein